MRKIVKDDIVEVISGKDRFVPTTDPNESPKKRRGRVLKVLNEYKVKVVRDKAGRVKKVEKVLEDVKLIVEGVNVRVKHQRPSKQFPQGGRILKEMPIAISKVMLVCPSCNRTTRVGFKLLEDGTKVRYCKRKDCGEIIK